jgi:hypothetical protein
MAAKRKSARISIKKLTTGGPATARSLDAMAENPDGEREEEPENDTEQLEESLVLKNVTDYEHQAVSHNNSIQVIHTN